MVIEMVLTVAPSSETQEAPMVTSPTPDAGANQTPDIRVVLS
jgi:hypothetical protein